jgi:hypothetical protein
MIRDRHYDVLGIAQNADAAAIRTAYRRLAMRYHPDVAGGAKDAAAERFRKIKQAYEVLSDAQQRARYDAQLDAAEPQAPRAPPWPSREPPWTPQHQTTALKGKRSSRSGTRHVARLVLATLAVLDILAIKSSPDLSVPLVICLFTIIMLAASPPNRAEGIGRSV